MALHVTQYALFCILFQRPSTQKSQTTTRRRREVTERELQSYLSSPQALAALSIGLNVERVKRAIREKLEQTGRAYSQPDALVEAALNLQHEEEDPSSHDSDTPLDSTFRNIVCTALEEVNSKYSFSMQTFINSRYGYELWYCHSTRLVENITF